MRGRLARAARFVRWLASPETLTSPDDAAGDPADRGAGEDRETSFWREVFSAEELPPAEAPAPDRRRQGWWRFLFAPEVLEPADAVEGQPPRSKPFAFWLFEREDLDEVSPDRGP